MSGAAFFPSMGNISNRKFIERMETWGWKVKKVRGETTLMETPHGIKCEVRSAHIRQGNSAKTFQEVLSVMDMTWEEFIRPMDADMQLAMEQYLLLDDEERRLIWDAAEVKHMTRMQRVKEQQRAQDLRKRDERRAAAKAERDRKRTHPQATPLDLHKPVFAESHEPEETTVADEEPKAEPKPDDDKVTLAHLKPGQVPSVGQVKRRVRGATNRTLDVLVAANEPVSIERLTKLLPDIRRDSIQQACLSLVRWNVAERVKPGVYRVRDEARRNGDVRVGVDITARAALPEPAPAVPAASPVTVQHVVPVQDVTATTAPVEPRPPAETRDTGRTADVEPIQKTYASDGSGDLQMDEMVNETLDLLFPQGFKARHLPLIDQWRQATIALMREING
jgi:hypothetical protein